MIKLTENGIVYELNPQNLRAKVIKSPSVSNTVFIPRSVIHGKKEYIIIRIEESAFEGNQHISSVLFDELSEVKTIGKNVFAGSSVRKFSIPLKLEILEEGWCKHSQQLDEIEMSPFNKSFQILNGQILISTKQHAIIFASRNVKKVTVPSYVTRIASYSFQQCNRLVSLSFEKNSQLKSIGKSAFQYALFDCFNVTENLKFLEEGWCSQNDKIKDIKLSSQNQFFEYIDNKYLIGKVGHEKVLFFVNRNIVNAIVPSCVTKIASDSFAYCKSLKSVSFEDDSKIKTISKLAFYNSNVESIYLPSSIECLEDGWCCGICKLNDISVSPKNEKFILYKQSLLIFDKKTIVFAKRNIVEVSIPSFITRIASFAFNSCYKLEKVSFEEEPSLAEISDDSFSFCYELVNVSPIPASVKKIGNCAFQNCESLQSIAFDLKSSLIELIDDYAFDSCQSLQSVSLIPKSVKKIGNCAFGGSNLKSISFQEGTEIEHIGRDSLSTESIEKIPIPEKVIGCSESFLMKQPNIINFDISPKNKFNEFVENKFFITKVDNEIILNYVNCNVKEAIIPSNVTRIGSCSFESCQKLESISFSNNSNIKSIGYSAFAYSSLKKLEIPESLEFIDDNWLFCVNYLIDIDLSPLNKYFKLIDNKILIRKINNNKLFNGYELIFAPRNIESFVIPSYITRINNYAFFYCSKLKSILFENHQTSTIKELGYSSFDQCESLRSIISIPSSLKIVNCFCFSNAKNLASLEFLSEEITFHYGSFFNCTSLSLLSFANAKKIVFGFSAFFKANNEIIIFALHNAQIIMQSY